VAQSAPFDMGNRLVSEVPAELTTALVNTPGGQRMALTLRTTSATVTVFLTKDVGEVWRDQIAAALSSMSGLILPGAGVL
jgi:hypothetical protein